MKTTKAIRDAIRAYGVRPGDRADLCDDIDELEAKLEQAELLIKATKLTAAHRADLQSYVDCYMAFPSCRNDRWPGSIASAIQAALQHIAELEAIVASKESSNAKE